MAVSFLALPVYLQGDRDFRGWAGVVRRSPQVQRQRLAVEVGQSTPKSLRDLDATQQYTDCCTNA